MSRLFCFCVLFYFKQKTAYEMRISDWSSDVCSSDLLGDIFGSERVLTAVFGALTIGVILPPLGNSFAALVAGQALQGLGVSLVPLGVALLTKQCGQGGEVRTAGIMTAGAISTEIGRAHV